MEKIPPSDSTGIPPEKLTGKNSVPVTSRTLTGKTVWKTEQMATADRFPKAPPLRFELTEEQAALVDAAKPPGEAALIVGYARRHPCPDPERFTFPTAISAQASCAGGGGGQYPIEFQYP